MYYIYTSILHLNRHNQKSLRLREKSQDLEQWLRPPAAAGPSGLPAGRRLLRGAGAWPAEGSGQRGTGLVGSRGSRKGVDGSGGCGYGRYGLYIKLLSYIRLYGKIIVIECYKFIYYYIYIQLTWLPR